MVLQTVISQAMHLLAFEFGSHLSDLLKEQVFVKGLGATSKNDRVVILLSCPFYHFLELLLLVLFDQVNFVPNLYVLVLEHVVRQADFFDYLENCFLLEVSLWVTDVSNMHYQIRLMQLF